MELVEGEDLSQLIAGSGRLTLGAGKPQRDSGPGQEPKAQSRKPGADGLPVEDVLNIARQIAEALEAAHEQGIIHRDLKPANIKVRADGTVKVLDFGLAKAMEPSSALRAPAGQAHVSQSPTLTTPAMTQAGMILGTAAYMSPEQARGKPVDKRTDIWAFGAVLYEMLAGVRPFDGEDATDMIAAVVKTTPDWSALPADVPRPIVTLIQRCLEKDRKARVGDIAVARFLLADITALETSAGAKAQGPEPKARSLHTVGDTRSCRRSPRQLSLPAPRSPLGR